MKGLGEYTTRVRLALVFAVVATTTIAVASASGASFESDHPPCQEPPGGGALLICPTGQVGKPYSFQLRGNEGCDDESQPAGGWYTFRVLNGALPAGLSLSSGGVISGVPTTAGEARVWLEINDLLAGQGGPAWCTTPGDESQREHSITIEPGLSIVNQTVKAGTIGQPYSETLTVKQVTSLNPLSGTDVSATWSVQSGQLPPGVTLSSEGVLSGTPTTEGSSQFVVQAQRGSQSDTETLSIVVRRPLAITASPPFVPSPPKSEVGVPFSVTLTPSGGSGTFTWALAGGTLPAGLAFDTTAGTITGTPRSPGRFAFSVTLADSEARTLTLNATLVVAAKLTIRTVQLRTAKLRRPYRSKVATLGGVQPVKWTLLRGELPRGVGFAKKLGTFVGIPRQAGTFRVTLQATDALGVSSRRAFVLRVR